jgi:hypothetical protein
MSYSELGLGVAKQWNLPERIVSSMKVAAAGPLKSDEAKMRAVADASNRLADAVRLPAGKQREAQLNKLESDYGETLGLGREQIDALLGKGAETFMGEVKSLGLPVGGSTFMQGVRALGPGIEARNAVAPGTGAAAGSPNALAATPRAAAGSAVDGVPNAQSENALAETMLNTITPEMGVTTAGMEAPSPQQQAQARQHMLSAGIQDITNSLAGEYQLNDVLRIILETMYRAIGFTRVMLCTRDPQTNSLRARLGFGADTDVIIKRGFKVPLEVSKDVFYGAVSKAADICIEDRESERIRAYIPAWYRDAVSARGFVLFPVIVNKKPVALIYADHEEAGRLRFVDGELNLLKTLRNQAILAIRQKT